MNSTNLVGRLTKDPERFETAKGRTVCRIRLAVDEMAQGDKPGYIDVATFDKPAQACLDNLTQGWLVAVSGRLVYREWEAEDGGKRNAISIIGHVKFLAEPRGNGGQASDYAPGGGVDENDEEIPF